MILTGSFSQSRSNAFEVTPASVRLRVKTNCESVKRALRTVACEAASASTVIDLTVDVDRELRETGSAPYFRGLHHVVYFSFGASCFVIDMLRHNVHATVTPDFAEDEQMWKGKIIPIVLGVLGPCVGVVPLHAASLIWEERGILLAGSSGAGKSTLAVALARKGLSIVSDDWTYIRADQGGLSCYGVGVPVKLLPDAEAHFAELHGMTPVISLNGELAFEVDVARTFAARSATKCVPSHIVFVERSLFNCGLHPRSAAEVSAFFRDSAERLPSRLGGAEQTRSAILSRVSTLPAYSFLYCGSPESGAEQLLAWIETL